jgi:Protein of unknown function (DUF4054)
VTFDVGKFRAGFREFDDVVKYPDAQVDFWSSLGALLLKECVWGDTWQYAMSLYVAHQITLASRNELTAALGGTPGTFNGPMNTKTVGGATAGYDSQAVTELGGGFWNLTNYGKQLYHLIKVFGAGAIQL